MFYSSTGERAAHQDAKFLIRHEIWPSTGSNRVGRPTEGSYSSEITDGPRSFREQFFLHGKFPSIQLREYMPNSAIIALCV